MTITDQSLAGSEFASQDVDLPRQLPGVYGALERLRRFRDTFNEGEPVDEESGLNADDLTVLIRAIAASTR